jgi:thiamine biosynthesis protein ThiS
MSETVDTSTIKVNANGRPCVVQQGSTVTDLLQSFEIPPARVVVQLDGTIVPRTDFAQTVLRDGCQLEIVTLVGGG